MPRRNAASLLSSSTPVPYYNKVPIHYQTPTAYLEARAAESFVGSYESVEPKSIPCTPPTLIGSDGKTTQRVTLGPGQGTVYFTSGGRTGGLPVSVFICPVTQGANYIASGYKVRNDYNPATRDSTATTVQFGKYSCSLQKDEFGVVTYKGFANGQYVLADAGGAAPAAQAQDIISTVLSRIP